MGKFDIMRHNTKMVKSEINQKGVLYGLIDSLYIWRTLRSNNLSQSIMDKTSGYWFINIKEVEKTIEKGNGKIVWFIPDFSIGSGGHTTIFRFIHHLEKLGVMSDIVICNGTQWKTEEKLKEIVDSHFFPNKANYKIVNYGDYNFNDKFQETYSLAMATSWDSAYYVRGFKHCNQRSYFVQDFEPSFYSQGSAYYFAEETYNFNFDFCVTAGDWLKGLMIEKYKKDAESFHFSYDRTLYYDRSDRSENGVKNVFYYARPGTERRGFELGMLTLQKVKEYFGENVNIILAGQDLSGYYIPFEHTSLGVLSQEELAKTFSQCHAALVLSLTNLSLMPIEILATGCQVIMNNGDNATWSDEGKLFTYANPNPVDLSDKIIKTLEGEITPQQKSQCYDEIMNISWESQAIKVKEFIMEKTKS